MKDKKIILRRPLYQYFGISFLVLSTTLFITFAIFSSFFVSRERERSEVLLRQLKHFIGFQYRPIAEEMWTENYEAILFRFSKISEQFGNAKYSIILANKDNKCVFAQSDSNPRFSCMTIGKLINLEKTRATNDSPEIVVNYDTDRKSYTAYCRLFVGDVDKGFLYAEFSDPHQLFHGSLTSFILQNFFPTLLFVFVVWSLWAFIAWKRIIKPYLRDLAYLEKNDATFRVANQVAHDIRSPLTALRILSESLQAIPEEQSQLLRNSIKRINEIAENLLLKSSGKFENSVNDGALGIPQLSRYSRSEQMLSLLLDCIINEKKIQYLGVRNVDLVFNIDSTNYGLFAKLRSSDFNRVISNLINNAYDALAGNVSGRIEVLLGQSRVNQGVCIEIKDNGRGISPEVLNSLLRVGGSYNKPSGHGLGLAHAKEQSIKWNGKLEIESKEGVGTKVTIEFPSCDPPAWHIEALAIKNNKKIIIVDDDSYIHSQWRRRFEKITMRNQIIDFYSLYEINNDVFSGDFILLMDFEFRNESQNGLDYLLKNGLIKEAILVTNRYDDGEILNSCLKNKVKMIPKPMVSYIPIIISE